MTDISASKFPFDTRENAFRTKHDNSVTKGE